MDCVFCKIAKKEIPKEFTYEDKDVMVFPDIHPLKPIHLLIMPKKHVKEFTDLTDSRLTQRIWEITQRMVRQSGLEGKGYRLTVNGGGAQIIDHFHIHLLGPMGKAAKM